MLQSLEKVPDNFDNNFRFLKKLTLKDYKEHLDDEMDGRLWVREIILNTQVHGPKQYKSLLGLACLV